MEYSKKLREHAHFGKLINIHRSPGEGKYLSDRLCFVMVFQSTGLPPKQPALLWLRWMNWSASFRAWSLQQPWSVKGSSWVNPLKTNLCAKIISWFHLSSMFLKHYTPQWSLYLKALKEKMQDLGPLQLITQESFHLMYGKHLEAKLLTADISPYFANPTATNLAETLQMST